MGMHVLGETSYRWGIDQPWWRSALLFWFKISFVVVTVCPQIQQIHRRETRESQIYYMYSKCDLSVDGQIRREGEEEEDEKRLVSTLEKDMNY